MSVQMMPEIVAWIACTNSLRSTDLMERRIDLFTVISFLVISGYLSFSHRTRVVARENSTGLVMNA